MTWADLSTVWNAWNTYRALAAGCAAGLRGWMSSPHPLSQRFVRLWPNR